jgi:hypothetical protein
MPPTSAPSMAQYMVGTPAKKVTSCSSMRRSASSASKRGSSTSVPPSSSVAFMHTVRP